MKSTVCDFPSPLGLVRVACVDGWTVGLAFAEGWSRVEDFLQRRFGGAYQPHSGSAPAVEDAVQRYFDGDLHALARLPIDPGGTPFQRAVWAALQGVPAGRTTFYGALARAIGAPKAARAVGAASGANPIWLAIPCHRALGNDGQLVGYAGGLARKRWLLVHEGGLPHAEPASFSSAVAFAQR